MCYTAEAWKEGRWYGSRMGAADSWAGARPWVLGFWNKSTSSPGWPDPRRVGQHLRGVVGASCSPSSLAFPVLPVRRRKGGEDDEMPRGPGLSNLTNGPRTPANPGARSSRRRPPSARDHPPKCRWLPLSAGAAGGTPHDPSASFNTSLRAGRLPLHSMPSLPRGHSSQSRSPGAPRRA
jgi:hypothetical protein